MSDAHRDVASGSPRLREVMERRPGFNPDFAGKMAECEGGSSAEVRPGVVLPAREFYRGRLTGLFFDTGDPPSRWYEMVALEVVPEGYEQSSVWCEEGFLFVTEG